MTLQVELLDQMLPQFFLKRQIPCLSDISKETQKMITKNILMLNLLSNDPITLLVDSAGGSVDYARYISDAIRCSVAPVTALVVGDAHSSAFLVVQHCHRRICYPHARLMFHGYNMDISPRCDTPDFAREVAETTAWHDEDLAFIARRTKQPLDQWKEWSREEEHFDATRAIRFGMIDEIVVPSIQ